ncbi:hypothetical protein C6Z66_001148 [Salmonella enterica subsp. enterica serovar Nima]|uniref:Lipoprotein n=1 Tax=Salmonella enterica TaxID=28901 RepID=A0A744UPH9_SALER|nr:hypothetical protein [Salmonella enterica subsp. enterica serovar Nima]EDU4599303.1 hypothetical protein [Salmonella enterica subsp. enterica serovar Nima]HAF2859002.1 hypothetical protein [Salmonella enterica]HAG0970065.1 hypothetical protein [Salmonella enterica]
MFSSKSTHHFKPFFVLPFIFSIAGCDNMGGISCDGKDEINSIKEQIKYERDKQKQQAAVLSLFFNPLMFDGAFDIKSIEEKKQDKEQKLLTCSANLIFSRDSEYGKSQSLPIEYTVSKTGETPSVNLTDVGKSSVIDTPPTEGQKKYKTNLDKQNKLIEAQRAEQEKAIKAEREKAQKEEEERLAQEVVRNKKINDEITDASLLPDDKFSSVSKDDLLYIFIAQSGSPISDNEKLKLFSDKWNSTQDAFIKRDIEKDELAKINSDINKFKEIKNIKFYIGKIKNDDKNIINLPRYKGDFRLNPVYNFDTQSFPITGNYCKESPYAQGQILSHRGIQLNLDRVLNSCELKIPESEARPLSDRFNSNISVDIVTTVYAHITGFEQAQNRIDIAILRQNVEIITQKRGEQKETINTVFK